MEFASQERLAYPIGFVAPGEFRKLAQHFGFYMGWLWSGLPYPKKIAATSCGAPASVLFAMVAKYFAEDTRVGEAAAVRTMRSLENLRMWDIFTMPANIVRALACTIASDLSTLVPDSALSENWKLPMRLARTAVSIGSEGYLMEEILNAPSIFSTQPLRNFLETQIDWAAVFSSPIEVEVATTDCRTGKALFYSTHDPRNQTPERMATIILESMRLSGEFPDWNLDGIVQADAEISSCFPIERFRRRNGERYGAVFFIPYTLVGDWPQGSTNFIGDIGRGFSIQVNRHMQRKMKRYLRAQCKDHAGRLPVLRTILTKELIAPLVFNSFTTKALRAGIDQGFRILQENLPVIMKTLKPLWVP